MREITLTVPLMAAINPVMATISVVTSEIIPLSIDSGLPPMYV
jgi:hypothetical protein